MNTGIYSLNQWASADGYNVRVQAWKDGVVYDSGTLTPANVRSIRALVEYANYSNDPLKFRLGQWLLFDTEGFAYEFEIRNQFYENDALRKLKEGMLVPGQQVKGWVAFQLPEDAQLSHVQFQSGSQSANTLLFRLDR